MKRLLGAIAGLLILGSAVVYADAKGNHSGLPIGTAVTPVPEPGAYVFLGLGALGLIAAYRSKMR